jgi:hypothetical protein
MLLAKKRCGVTQATPTPVILSNCVECQGVLGDKFGFLCLSIAFKMHTSLCMAATSATFMRSISR